MIYQHLIYQYPNGLRIDCLFSPDCDRVSAFLS